MRIACALLLCLLIAAPLRMATAEVSRLMPATYILDDVGGNEYAFYEGPGMRSYVDPKFMVTSFKQLEERASNLPAGTSIAWNPSKRTASGKPLLFGKEENAELFLAFCKDHHLHLDVPPIPPIKP